MASQTTPQTTPDAAAKAAAAANAKAAKAAQVIYDRAVKNAKAASASADKAAWVIGDAALTVETAYSQNKLGAFADDIGRNVATVRNFRTMAARYPADKIARDLQSATVYGIFTSQDDAFDLVTNGDDGKPWKTSRAQELVKSRKTVSDEPAGDGGSEDESPEAPAEDTPEIALAKAEAEVTRLEGALVSARAKVAKIRAELAASQVKPAIVHTVKGVPSHTPDQPRKDCKLCAAAAKVTTITPAAGRRTRKPAANAA